MIDRFFLGTFFIILLLLGGYVLYERTELERLEIQIAELRYEVEQVEKKQRVVAQDSDFMLRLINGVAFKEVEE